ncbi:MAG: hypothetical protein JJT76_13575 [Clostridiaceae bacterium]|nr:hypothetical protein [Clostridiaceae bacterium]
MVSVFILAFLDLRLAIGKTHGLSSKTYQEMMLAQGMIEELKAFPSLEGDTSNYINNLLVQESLQNTYSGTLKIREQENKVLYKVQLDLTHKHKESSVTLCSYISNLQYHTAYKDVYAELSIETWEIEN